MSRVSSWASNKTGPAHENLVSGAAAMPVSMQTRYNSTQFDSTQYDVVFQFGADSFDFNSLVLLEQTENRSTVLTSH